MRVFAGLAVFVALTTTAILFAYQQQIEKKHAGDGPCRDENILMGIWRDQSDIGRIEQDGADVIVRVNMRSWQKMPRSLQVKMGKTAYCAVALARKHGVLRLEGDYGRELGRVMNGHWYSKLYPE